MWNRVLAIICTARTRRLRPRAIRRRFACLAIELFEDRVVLAPGEFTLAPLGGDGIIITALAEQNTIMIDAKMKAGVMYPMAIDTYRWDILSEEQKQINLNLNRLARFWEE